MNKKSFPTAFLFLLRGPGGPTRSELAKRLTELRLIFQPWRLQFACVFSRICVWVLFLTLLNPATNYFFFKKILCVRLSNLCFPCVSGLEEVKSVALRACWKLLEEVKRVASRACLKHWSSVNKTLLPTPPHPTPQELKSVAARACLKQCEQDIITHSAPPHRHENKAGGVLQAASHQPGLNLHTGSPPMVRS